MLISRQQDWPLICKFNNDNYVPIKQEQVTEKPDQLKDSDNDTDKAGNLEPGSEGGGHHAQPNLDRKRNKDLEAVDKLPWAHPKRMFATMKLVATYGITRDVIAHQSNGLEDVHRRAIVYNNKVKYLWTTAQVCTATYAHVYRARCQRYFQCY